MRCHGGSKYFHNHSVKLLSDIFILFTSYAIYAALNCRQFLCRCSTVDAGIKRTMRSCVHRTAGWVESRSPPFSQEYGIKEISANPRFSGVRSPRQQQCPLVMNYNIPRKIWTPLDTKNYTTLPLSVCLSVCRCVKQVYRRRYESRRSSKPKLH